MWKQARKNTRARAPKHTFENSEIESLGLELKLERQERKKALEQIDKLKSQLSSSQGHVKRQRGLNAMLWTRLRNLEEKLATGNADQEERFALARAEIETWAEITESSGREARA